jgi:alpha-glucuronidase
MTPLGLHHQMAWNHHYGPGPWIADGRPDWTSAYYHRADSAGIGFDRSSNGSDAVSQYHEDVADVFGSIDRVPDELLLWFQHVSWDHIMPSGRILWDELALRYQRGVDRVRGFRATWQQARSHVDARRAEEIARFMVMEESDATWWRDASLLYFQTFSGRPLPDGVEAPGHTLDHYMSIRHHYVPGSRE